MNTLNHYQQKQGVDTTNARRKPAIYVAPPARMDALNKRRQELQEDINRLEAQMDEIETKKGFCYATLLVLEQGEDGLCMSDLVEFLARDVDGLVSEYIVEAEERGELSKTFNHTLQEYEFNVTSRVWRMLGF